MKMITGKRLSADNVFSVLLLICVVAMIASGLAWARGWENGPYVLLFSGALANVPMFHFAMNWPLRNLSKQQVQKLGQSDAAQPAAAADSKSEIDEKLKPESERLTR